MLVGGSPGSGKTTLARVLGERLGYPVIGRDALKEVLLDALPPADRAAASRLGMASWPMLYAVLDALIDRVPGVIIESNFRRGRSEGEARPFVARCRSVFVQCDASWDAIAGRIAAREGDPTRHPGHFDQVALPMLAEQFADGQFEPLALDIPVIRVRTDAVDGYAPSLDALVAEIVGSRDRS